MSSNSNHSFEELDATEQECPPVAVAVAPTVAVRGKKMFKLVAAAGDRSSSLPFSKRGGAADNVKNDSHNNKCNSKNSSCQDLLSPLPEDVLCRITSFLDARSLLQMRRINRSFHCQAARNCAGWDNLTDTLWKDKIHVCAEALHMRNHINTCTTPPGSAQTADQDTNNSNSNSNNNIHNSSLAAYKLSLQDSLQRHHVTRQELCYDPVSMRGTVWSFRFKESAGSDWTIQDPWYNGLPCRKMVFLPDGSVKQYIPAATTAAGNAYALRRTAQDGTLLQHPQHHPLFQQQQPHQHHHHQHHPQPQQLHQHQHHHPQELQQLFNDRPGLAPPNFGQRAAAAVPAAAVSALAVGRPTLVDPHMTMTWRFLTRPMDLPTRETGSYVRFSVGGRDVPTYSVRRSPVGNWGFIMESCWGIYASFELPPKIVVPPTHAIADTVTANADRNSHHHRGAVRQERSRRRLRRTEDGSVWVDEIEDEEEEDAHPHARNNSNCGRHAAGDARERARIEGEASLRDDASLLITNEIQWREAFLYNVGARVLPEGDEAADEFDRAWGGL